MIYFDDDLEVEAEAFATELWWRRVAAIRAAERYRVWLAVEVLIAAGGTL